MKKIGLLISLALILNVHLIAQNNVVKEEAEIIAKSFLKMEDDKHQKSNLIIESQYTNVNENGEALYHVFNFENGGFVIVAGDKRTQPILAYSTTNTFPIDNTNSAANFWVEHQYAKPINALKKDESIVATTEITQKWNEIVLGKKHKAYATKVEPLLTSKWNQNKYYNALCPVDVNESSYNDYHVPNGCVALAMAQIMYYHRYPSQGNGYKRYRCGKYGYLDANFAQTTYNYEAMSDEAKDYSDAIARLVYHAGVAVEMGYAVGGSGAQSDDVFTAFPNYFSFGSSNLLSKSNFTDSVWRDTIKSNLNAGLPVYYAAASSATGFADDRHAFVCDGYKEDDLFHFNWGWGGTADGYYVLGAMTPQSYVYNLENRMILNIRPQEDKDTNNFFSGTKTLKAMYGSFNDGSGRFDYRNNTNCSWLISPQDGEFINNIILKVSKFSLGDGDSVYIYSGNSQSGTLFATLSGEVAFETSYTISNSEAFVVFKSDNDGIVGNGFTFTYTTSKQSSSYCASSPSPGRETADSGTVTNGTPDGVNYVSSNKCYWAIAPANANGQIKLAFSKFDLNYGDVVEFYGYGSGNLNAGSWTNSSPVYSFSKDNPPTLNQLYTISRHTALVSFRTDNDLTASGFEIYWNAAPVSVDEYVENITDLFVYPNPSTDHIVVDLTTSSDETIQLSIYDLVGKKVYSTNSVEVAGNYSEKIDVSNFAKGIYLLRVATTHGTITKKVVIK